MKTKTTVLMMLIANVLSGAPENNVRVHNLYMGQSSHRPQYLLKK